MCICLIIINIVQLCIVFEILHTMKILNVLNCLLCILTFLVENMKLGLGFEAFVIVIYMDISL